MWYSIVFLRFTLLLIFVNCKEDEDDSSAQGGLITQLRNEANMDLSLDEEYEDLRAELLAYHTALASLSTDDDTKDTRRSLLTTPCWQLGGICVNYKLCTGFRFLTEVPGCKDKLNVCCFTWNRYQVRDMRDQGLGTLVMPWQANQQEFGGEGIKVVSEEDTKVKRNSRNKKPKHPKETRELSKMEKPRRTKKLSKEEVEGDFSRSIRNYVKKKENEKEKR